MFTIGLTGQIASGKTTIARLFEKLGVYLINADDINRHLIAPGEPAYHEIASHFGDKIISSSGDLNKNQLRQIITNQPSQKNWLENLLHPLIQQQIIKQLKEAIGCYAMVEIPLLTNRQKYPFLNRVLFIQISKDLQINRVMARDNCSKEDAIKMINMQADQKEYMTIADDCIQNEGSLEQAQEKVTKLHQQYLNMAKSPY